MLYRALSAPIGAQIELTTRCSNNCPHCYNFWRAEDEVDKTISLQELRTMFGALARAEVFYVTVTGGEPMLYPALLVEAVRLCAESGISCSVNSNLTVATEKLISEMKEAGPFTVLTSIASSDESVHDAMMGRPGALRRTLKGIDILKAQGISIGVNMVVSQLNAEHVYNTGLFAYELGAKSFSATKASPPLSCVDYSAIRPTPSQVKASLDALLRLHEDTGINVDILECYPLCFLGDIEKYERFSHRNCSAGVFSGTIGADGQVRPCSHSNRTYGNILDEEMTTIYARMTEWRTGELLPTKCLGCNHFSRCSGGCRCEAEYDGDIRGMDSFATDSSFVTLPEKESSVPFVIGLETQVETPPSVLFREEDFGYVLKQRRKVVMVDEEAGQMLLMLSDSRMTLSDLLSTTGAEEAHLESVLKRLCKKGIVTLHNPEYTICPSL